MNITTDELGFSIGITHADQLADRTRHDGETEIGVRHFATAELKAELHFIAVAEKFFGVADFGEEIAVGDTRAKFDFLDLARRGFHVRSLLLFLVHVLAEIHDTADRRGGVGRDFDEIEVSQQCVVVIGEDDDAARAALAKASRVYGGHMGEALEEHGIWGSPQGVIERIERHVKLGCTSFIMEFFGRDTREPARLFAREVLPAFRS